MAQYADAASNIDARRLSLGIAAAGDRVRRTGRMARLPCRRTHRRTATAGRQHASDFAQARRVGCRSSNPGTKGTMGWSEIEAREPRMFRRVGLGGRSQRRKRRPAVGTPGGPADENDLDTCSARARHCGHDKLSRRQGVHYRRGGWCCCRPLCRPSCRSGCDRRLLRRASPRPTAQGAAEQQSEAGKQRPAGAVALTRPLSATAHAAFCLAWISLRLIKPSAICTALRAAPLRRLSETHQSEMPFSTVASSRMRLT